MNITSLVTDRGSGAVSKNYKGGHQSSELFSDIVKRRPKNNIPMKPSNQAKRPNASALKTPQGEFNKNSTRVRGVRRGDGCSTFRSVRRLADVFLNRVHVETPIDTIKSYITDTFNVNCVKIEQLEIQTSEYSAFKITVPLSERDLLFRSELWPEDVVVGKYYNKKKTHNSNNRGNTS